MEPSGRNRWQPVANRAAAKTAQTGENRLVSEGVDGSSPSEGFAISLQINCFCLQRRRRVTTPTSTERPRLCGIAFAEGRKRWPDACGVKKLGSGLQPLICSADAAGPKILEPPE